MRLAANDWRKYIDKLARINATAAEQMQAYIDRHGYDDMNAVIEYAYALATKYGEASGALACEMYDAIAEASGKELEPAEMADTATYSETAKAVNGTMLNQYNSVPQTVGRLVKQVGADTTLKNALRDGAKFAWIPHGDTCAFCITLASRGWQYMSKRALKGGHAQHIHANCDCEYAISFDADPKVEGYNPEQYKKMYYGAQGDTPQDKINAMRREMYAKAKKEAEKAAERTLPTFTPAKTIEEAQKFAEQYVSGGYKSVVNYKGVELEYANEFNRAFNDVLSQYSPKYKLRSIQPMNMRDKRFKGTDADAAYQWSLNDLFFNKGYYKSSKELQKHLDQYHDLLDRVLPSVDMLLAKHEGKTDYVSRKQYAYLEALKLSKRTNVSNVEPYKTMVHELGHYLDDTLFRSKYKEAGFDLSASFAQYSTHISAYATTNTQEYVAESFLAYWTGEKDKIDPQLAAIFEGARN